MTEAEARQACMSFMEESPSFKMCKDIPNVNSDIAMNTCVLDILVVFLFVLIYYSDVLLQQIHKL